MRHRIAPGLAVADYPLITILENPTDADGITDKFPDQRPQPTPAESNERLLDGPGETNGACAGYGYGAPQGYESGARGGDSPAAETIVEDAREDVVSRGAAPVEGCEIAVEGDLKGWEDAHRDANKDAQQDAVQARP